MTIAIKSFRLSLLCTLVLCAGCAVGPDFKRPEPPTGTALTRNPVSAATESDHATGTAQRFESGTKIQREWWTLYSSPTLNSLVELALKNNPTIDAAQASLKQAQALATSQRGFYLPNVQVSYSPQRQANSSTIAPTLNSGETPFH